MSPVNKSNSGMSVMELVVSLGVFGIFMTGANQLYHQFSAHQWSVQNQLIVKQEVAAVAAAVNKFFPESMLINSTVNPLNDPKTWVCSGVNCSLRSDNNQNGLELFTRCEATTENALLKRITYHSLPELKAEDNCLVCPSGQRPILRVRFYQNGVIKHTFKFPKTIASEGKRDGVVGMGLCFNAPARSASIGDVYDQWIISLVPVYFSQIPLATDDDATINAKIVSSRENIMISPLEQLGSKIKVMK